jgi:hypothetical protein
MIKRNKVQEKSVSPVRRERAAAPWKNVALGIMCSVILVGGLFNAAKQHFSTVTYSMDNSELQKTKVKLVAEKRKLEVERDEALAPQNVERAGLKIGLKKFSSQDFQFIEAGKTSSSVDNPKTMAENKSKDAADAKSLVTRTVAQKKVDAAKAPVAKEDRVLIARR